MAKTFFSRNDIQSLAERMDARAWSPLVVDMPELQRDIRQCAALLHWITGLGIPITHVELDIWNGTI